MTTISASSFACGESALESAVGNGCRNHIDFRGSFRTDAGSACGSCSSCEGSAVNSLFIPQAEDTCIQCSKEEENCRAFEVIASFEDAWTMKHTTSLTSIFINALASCNMWFIVVTLVASHVLRSPLSARLLWNLQRVAWRVTCAGRDMSCWTNHIVALWTTSTIHLDSII